MDYANTTLADRLAAGYVAGTLRGPARRRFDALLAAHPGLRAAVRQWEDRLLPLTTALPPVPPPPRLWARIEHRLWPRAPDSAVAAAVLPWWQRLAPWRALSAAASVATLALALLLALPGAVPPPVVVVLQATPAAAGTAQQPALAGTFVASVSGDGGSLVMRPLQPVALQPDRAFELWSVPPQGAPRSLGLVRADGLTVLDRKRLPQTLLRGGTAALAVSLEPPGGSPTGAPTGPVVFAGQLQL